MGSPCLFTRQRALKMGYVYWLRVKFESPSYRVKSWLPERHKSFILKVKLHLLT